MPLASAGRKGCKFNGLGDNDAGGLRCEVVLANCSKAPGEPEPIDCKDKQGKTIDGWRTPVSCSFRGMGRILGGRFCSKLQTDGSEEELDWAGVVERWSIFPVGWMMRSLRAEKNESSGKLKENEDWELLGHYSSKLGVQYLHIHDASFVETQSHGVHATKDTSTWEGIRALVGVLTIGLLVGFVHKRNLLLCMGSPCFPSGGKIPKMVVKALCHGIEIISVFSLCEKLGSSSFHEWNVAFSMEIQP